MEYMPKSVRAIIPSDLRTHVSRGAALHSIGYHGFSKDFIEPIVSEDINIVLFGNNMKCLVKASTPVPSEEFTLDSTEYDKNQTNTDRKRKLTFTLTFLYIYLINIIEFLEL